MSYDPRIQSLLPSEISSAYRIDIFCFSTSKRISFPAFLTDFSDSFKLDFSNTTVLGRMDPIYSYKNTVRTVTLGFDIPNNNADESSINSSQIDTLIQSLYPVYSSEAKQNGKGTYIVSSPPMFRIKFCNLISNSSINEKTRNENDSLQEGLLGFIPTFDFKPKIDSGFFNLGNKLYPKLISVNLTLNVVHEHPLGNKFNENGDIVSRRTDEYSTYPHGYYDYIRPIKPPKENTEASATSKVEGDRSKAEEENILG